MKLSGPKYQQLAHQQLTHIFGSRIPADADAAVRMLEDSPVAPTSAAELQALRAVVLQGVGQQLDQLEGSAALTAHSQPVGTGQRPLGGVMSLMLAERGGGGLEKVISLTRARELFTAFAEDKSVPHDFVDEGCHFRSHLANKMLEDAGVYSEKAFCVPDGGDLKIRTDKTPVGFTLGMFHAAACVHVRGDDGEVRRLVLDPSLFPEPVDVATWQNAMGGLNRKPTDVLYLPRFASHLMDRDAPPATWRVKDLEDARAWNTQYKEVQDSMKEMGFYDHLTEMVADAEAHYGFGSDGAHDG